MPKLSPGTWIERELFESKAYLALKGIAPQLLILIYGKRKFEKHGKKGNEKRVCVNGDCISFTYIEARKKYGITFPRFLRGIDDLLSKGFLKIEHQGGGYQKDKTIFALSGNWIIWKPGMNFNNRKKERNQRGYLNKE
uniref:Uncharacterized protein n=1 Tax=viral metagenome TaxID=1070528 RepID=A0A6M3J678_9ZZZZ